MEQVLSKANVYVGITGKMHEWKIEGVRWGMGKISYDLWERLGTLELPRTCIIFCNFSLQ